MKKRSGELVAKEKTGTGWPAERDIPGTRANWRSKVFTGETGVAFLKKVDLGNRFGSVEKLA